MEPVTIKLRIGVIELNGAGNGRLALLETEINGKELPPHAFSFNQNLGLLEGVNDLRVYRNSFNRTVIQVHHCSLSINQHSLETLSNYHPILEALPTF